MKSISMMYFEAIAESRFKKIFLKDVTIKDLISVEEVLDLGAKVPEERVAMFNNDKQYMLTVSKQKEYNKEYENFIEKIMDNLVDIGMEENND